MMIEIHPDREFIAVMLKCSDFTGTNIFLHVNIEDSNKKKGVPSAESSRSVQGLGKGVSGKPYPRLCNARRPRLEPGTFRSPGPPSNIEDNNI